MYCKCEIKNKKIIIIPKVGLLHDFDCTKNKPQLKVESNQNKFE